MQTDEELTGEPERRRRTVLLAGATAIAAVVVAAAAVTSGTDGDSTDPVTSTSTGSPAPSAIEPTPAGRTAVIPAGWRADSYQGLTFAVPPGTPTADPVEPGPEPAYSWHGPDLGHPGAYAWVRILIRDHGGDIPEDVDPDVVVPGAVATRTGIGPLALVTAGSDAEFEVTAGGIEIFTGDTVVLVFLQFPAGAEGEQMAEDLIASIDATGL